MVIRWGIVGCGGISADFVTAVKTIGDDHQVVAVAARDLNRAKKFAETHGIGKYYGSYEELAQDPDVDVAYIGTVASCHFSQSKLMLDHGRHVLCEKPLCMNAKQVRELVDHAREKKVFLMEAMWARFNPAYVEITRQIEAGVMGEPVHVNSSFGFDLSFAKSISSREAGGGSLIHGGIYNVHLALVAFGRQKPLRVLSTGSLNEEGLDTSDCTTLVFPGGKTATMVTNCLLEYTNEAFIAGTKGIIRIKAPFCSTDEIETPLGKYSVDVPKDIKFNLPNSYILRYEAIEVGRCIAKGQLQSERMSWDDSIVLHETMDMIKKELNVVYDED